MRKEEKIWEWSIEEEEWQRWTFPKLLLTVWLLHISLPLTSFHQIHCFYIVCMLTIVFEYRSASHVQKGTHSILNQQWVLYLSLLNGKRRENSGKYLIILYFCFICKPSCLKLRSTFIFIMAKFYSFILYLPYFYLWNWKIIWFTTFESFFKNYLNKRCFSWEFIQLSQEKKDHLFGILTLLNH